MLLVACSAALAVTPYAGAEWRPLSRGDLTWVDEGDTSGLLVAGLDGFVRPQLMAYAGAWVSPHIGAHASLGVARLQTTTWSEEVYVQRHWGVVRPAFDVRVSLLARHDRRPIPWLFIGGHVDLPSARDTSNGYTRDELELANRTATLDRIRLGAIGSRLGAGVDVGLIPAVRLGLQWAIDWQRTLFKGSDPTAITQWVSAEGALLLEFHWPRKEASQEAEDEEAAGDDPDQETPAAPKNDP